MPVKLTAPEAASLLPVKGVQLGFAEAYVKKPNRKDVLVIKLAEGTKVAGVFTKNLFCIWLQLFWEGQATLSYVSRLGWRIAV